MRRSNDVSSVLAHDVERVAVEIIVAVVVDKVYRTLYEAVLDISTAVRVARRNPCILIAVHAAVVEHKAVVLGVKGQSLRSGILLNAIRVYEAYALEVEVLARATNVAPTSTCSALSPPHSLSSLIDTLLRSCPMKWR